MNRIMSLVILGMVLVGCKSAQYTTFSGTWQLDLKESTNLPESFKHVDSYTMDVDQTNDSMFTTVRLAGDGQDVKFPPTYYALNGTETFREDTLRMSKRWNKLSWTEDGKQCVVESRVEQGREAQSQTYVQRDVWEIVNNDTLHVLVTQTYLLGKEPHSERRVFHRVK